MFKTGNLRRLQEISGGSQRRVWRAKWNGRSVYIKKCKSDFSRMRFESGIRAQRLAYENGLRVPEILLQDQNCLVETTVRGRPLSEIWASKSHAVKRLILLQLARSLVQLHAIKGPAYFEDVPVKGSAAPRMREVLRLRITRLAPQLGRRLNWALRECARIDETGGARLTHFDLNPGNVLYSAEKGIGFVDFENSRFYDPVWDLVAVVQYYCIDKTQLKRDFLRAYRESAESTILDGFERRYELYLALFRAREKLRDN